jgi:hypothetical protein
MRHWDSKARHRLVWIGSCGGSHAGGVTRVRLSQLSILLHIRFVITSGVCCLVKCCQNVTIACVRAVVRGSLRQHRTWFVSSHSRLHAKHLPSVLLSSFWSRHRVGRRSFINLDVWMRCPIASDRSAWPNCCQAMLSRVSSVHGLSRPVAVCERSSKYSRMAGACAAVRM